MPDPSLPSSYPMAHLVARHGGTLALAAGSALALLGLVAVISGAAWWTGLAFASAGGLAYVLLRSYGELVRILLDILLPQ